MRPTHTTGQAAAAKKTVRTATGHCTLEVHDALLSLTLRMIDEYPEYPAGSVMRCVARAVRRALMVGTPREQIAARAEDGARRALAGRNPGSMASHEPTRKAPLSHDLAD